MARRRRLILPAAILLATAGIALAPSGCGDGAGSAGAHGEIPLRYVYRAGDTWVQEGNSLEESIIDAVLLGETGDAVHTQDTTKDRRTFTVQEVTEEGEATVTLLYETLDRTIDGQPQDFTDTRPQEITFTIDGTGQVRSADVDIKGLADTHETGYHQSDQYAAALDAIYDITAIHYPEGGRARVGEEWSLTYELSAPGVGVTKATLEARLSAVNDEGGRQIATIDYTVTTPSTPEIVDVSADFARMIGDRWDSDEMGEIVVRLSTKTDLGYTGTVRVDVATGRLISSSGTTSMSMQYEYIEAPEALLPVDQRGPFGWGGTGTVDLVEVK